MQLTFNRRSRWPTLFLSHILGVGTRVAVA